MRACLLGRARKSELPAQKLIVSGGFAMWAYRYPTVRQSAFSKIWAVRLDAAAPLFSRRRRGDAAPQAIPPRRSCWDWRCLGALQPSHQELACDALPACASCALLAACRFGGGSARHLRTMVYRPVMQSPPLPFTGPKPTPRRRRASWLPISVGCGTHTRARPSRCRASRSKAHQA